MNRSASVLVGVAVAAVLLFCGIWYWQAYPYSLIHVRRGFMGTGMMMGPGMGIIMLLFWVAVIAVGARAISAIIRPTSPRHASGYNALEILKQRYARGEIEKSEYEAKRRDLER